nr:unnamed protein product [Callosobruchus analis]
MGNCVQTSIGPACIPLESETLSDNDESSSDQSDNNRGVGEVGSHKVQVIWNDCTGQIKYKLILRLYNVHFFFRKFGGLSVHIFCKKKWDEPLHFDKLFLEDTIPIIVQQTKMYAEQNIISCIANETMQKIIC